MTDGLDETRFPPNSEPPEIPERGSVTICIAAACMEAGENRLVLCSDWLMSGSLGKSETTLKIRPVTEDWQLLVAGEDHEIAALAPMVRWTVKEIIARDGNIDERNAVEVMRMAMARRKRERAEEITQATFAMPFDEFKQHGKERLPPDAFREAHLRIGMPLGAEFILCGMPDRTPFIVETRRDGSTRVREGFAVIGAGAYLAQAALMNRGLGAVSPLAHATYCVYEAKRYAENEVSVGKSTNLYIIDEDNNLLDLSHEGLELLAKEFQKRGPQSLGGLKALPRRLFWTPADWEEALQSERKLPPEAPPEDAQQES